MRHISVFYNAYEDSFGYYFPKDQVPQKAYYVADVNLVEDSDFGGKVEYTRGPSRVTMNEYMNTLKKRYNKRYMRYMPVNKHNVLNANHKNTVKYIVTGYAGEYLSNIAILHTITETQNIISFMEKGKTIRRFTAGIDIDKDKFLDWIEKNGLVLEDHSFLTLLHIAYPATRVVDSKKFIARVYFN